MKKIKLALATSAFVLGIFATFAFRPAETQSGDPVLHWFDANTGQYNGTKPLSQATVECPGEDILCQRGYESVTSGDDPQGVGTPVDLMTDI